MLKTQTHTGEEVFRKSIKQRHKGHYPIFVYNLGLKKVVIQTCVGREKQLIYELPKNHIFVSFVDYHSFNDIGFNP